MAAISPSTNLRLIKNPLELSSSNQLTFNNIDNQTNYFLSLPSINVDNFTYQRKDYTIRYGACIDDIITFNYVMYQNDAYSDKWFYAYITDMKWINDKMTEITIKTDVFQTWQFDMEFKTSFIEREHVNNDTIGLHTVPENLESGEYIVENQESNSFMNAHVVLSATWDWVNEKTAGSFINGLYHGTIYYVLGEDAPNISATISYLLNIYASKGKSDAITGLFMVPDALTNYDNIEWDYMFVSGGFNYYPYKTINYLESSGSVNMGSININKEYSSVNGYIPKNNKLYTYPYKYILCNNNNGSSAEYMYEYFSTDKCEFHTEGVLTPGCSVRMNPRNYKGTYNNNAEGLNLGKYPICSYTTDMYTNWLTQNSVNIGVSLASSTVGMVGGVAMMATGAGAIAGAGAVTSSALSIASTLGQIHQYKTIPPQAEGNTNCGDVIYAGGKCTFSYYKMSIKSEYAKIIDDYFSMYGYKVNSVKIPNLTGRKNWNYVKTIGATIHGYFPDNDLKELKQIFDNGVTLWHNPNTFLDYSQSNNIM